MGNQAGGCLLAAIWLVFSVPLAWKLTQSLFNFHGGFWPAWILVMLAGVGVIKIFTAEIGGGGDKSGDKSGGGDVSQEKID